jgi:betaine reductase
VVATAVCGDDLFAAEPDRCARSLLAGLDEAAPDVLLAGPAFGSGRYGFACGRLCEAAADRGLAAAAALHADNPAVPLFARTVVVVPASAQATGMAEAMAALAELALSLDGDGALQPPRPEALLGWRERRNVLHREPAAVRAVDLLLARLRGLPADSEIPLPAHEVVPASPPVAGLREATVALVTDGGLVAKNNPERMPSGRSTRYCRLPLDGLQRLSAEAFDIVHHGYDNRHVAADPNRLVPLDALLRCQREGLVGRVHPFAYSTAGVGTGVQAAAAMGRQLAAELRQAGVQAAILTST